MILNHMYTVLEAKRPKLAVVVVHLTLALPCHAHNSVIPVCIGCCGATTDYNCIRIFPNSHKKEL